MPGWREVLQRRGPLIALTLAAFLCLPAGFAKLFADDYFQQLTVIAPPGEAPGRPPWDLFTFADGNPEHIRPFIERGPFMWLTWPQLRMRFFRPLSSVLMTVDQRLFGPEPFWPHVESVLWYLALVAVVSALFSRTLGPAGGLLAPLAMVLFAIDDVHWLSALWLANRNSLIATTPVLLGLLLHLRWREDGWRPGAFLAVPLFALGLLGGESSLGALAYVFAYEVVAGPGGWKARARALAPVLSVGLGYVALYKHFHAGAQGSGIYIDPATSPVAFLVHAPERALALMGAQFLASPADGWLLMEQTHPVLIGIGLVALVLLGLMLRACWPAFPESSKRHLKWWTAGVAFSLVPVLATFPLNRLLLMPSMGAAVLVAALLVYAPRQGWLKAGVAVLFFCNVLMAPVGWAGSYFVGGRAQNVMFSSAFDTPLTDAELARRDLFFAAPDVAVGMYVPMVRLWAGKARPESWLCFSLAQYAHRLTRVDEGAFDLEVLDGRMGETVFEQITRAPEIAYAEGMEVTLNGAKVKVTQLDQGLPKKLHITLTEPLSSETYTFVQWKDGKLQRLELPAVGASIELPYNKGPLAY